MYNDLRMMMAAQVASGLISAHGIDHGGVDVETVGQRALAITDAIIAAGWAERGNFAGDAGNSGDSTDAHDRFGSGSTSGGDGAVSSSIETEPAK
jgi:hypothetical protein